MRTVKNGTMRGTRVGAGPAGELYDRGLTVAKVVVLYHCANKHQTLGAVHLDRDATAFKWECRVCSQPAGTNPLDPPGSRGTSVEDHLERVRDRRTQVEGDRLMAESLARRDA